MRLYIDDVRQVPDGFDHHSKTYEDALITIKGRNETDDPVDFISFDHDLGTEKTGYDIAKFIEESAHYGLINTPIDYQVHSANPVGRQNIMYAMMSAWRVWSNK